MGKEHRLKKRKQSDAPLGLPLNFLLGCSQQALENYALARLADISDTRKEMLAVIDRLILQRAQSIVAEWFRKADRASINQDLAEEESPLEWAKRKIRNGQRSKEELEDEFFPGLPLGAAHLAAAIRYQERNIAEGKCQNCPEPLDPSSVRYCTKHLTAMRHRKARKAGVKGEPGSADYLYGEITESTHGRQPGSLAALAMNREKATRAILAELGIPPEHAAVSINAAKDALLRVMPDSKEKGMTRDQLYEAATIPAKSTGQKAIERLLAEGKVQRVGKGVCSSPYLYFLASGLEDAKSKLAEGQAIENAGRHLRGPRS